MYGYTPAFSSEVTGIAVETSDLALEHHARDAARKNAQSLVLSTHFYRFSDFCIKDRTERTRRI